MGNSCCTPSVSGSGHLNYQSSPVDADRPSTEEPQRSSRHAGTSSLPISPRRSSGGCEENASFSTLPSDVQRHIGSLLPRQGRSAFRQTSQTLNQVLPRGAHDAMHPIEGAHALLGIDQATPNDEAFLAVRSAIQAASNSQEWQSKSGLLAAARHTVQQLGNHPDRLQLLQGIESAIQAGELTEEQWRRADAVLNMMVNARNST